MKQGEENVRSCGAESVAAMTVIGALAQSLVLMGPKHEAAVHSALDAAASSLEIMAMSAADSGEMAYVEALGIVEELRACLPQAKDQWPHGE